MISGRKGKAFFNTGLHYPHFFCWSCKYQALKHAATLLLLALLATLPTVTRAQQLIRAEAQADIPQFLLELYLPIAPQYSLKNYKIVYRTTDTDGQPTEASGLLTLPDNDDTVFPVAAYMHGTALDRDRVPSNPVTEERFLVYALATSGYIAIAPDYLGYGVNEGFHPYVHAASEASAGRDMITAVREFLDQEGIRHTGQLFVTGYSQGGHASSALHRDIQEKSDSLGYEVTAGAHLSGPYSISGVMREATLTNERPTLPGFIVYTYVSYNNVYGLYDNLGQAFVSPYLEVIDSFNRKDIDGEQFNARLDTLLRQRDERLIDMFQDSLGEQIVANDPDSRIIQALRANDTYAWAPEAPTLLYYCTADEQVPFRNAIVADSVMRSLGSTSVLLESGGALDHGGCVEPALRRALAFFDSLADRYPTALPASPSELPEVGISPNPAAANAAIRLSGVDPAGLTYALYDPAGRLVRRGPVAADGTIPVGADRVPGLHLLRVNLTDGRYVVRKLLLR